MSKILITGSTGFIGKWLLEYLIKKEHNIIAHGSSLESINYLKKNLENDNIDLGKIEFWEQDFLKNKWSFPPNISYLDSIINTAAATRVRTGVLENYDEYFKLNVVCPKILAKKALEINIKHFIHLSTGQIFGIPETYPITENTPKNPINLYGITKLMGEQVIKSFGLLGLNYTIARPFSVYGPGHYNIISIITNKILKNETLTIYGDGSQSRAFSHVIDFCQAIELILYNEKCYGEEFNICGNQEFSVNELVPLISNSLNKKPKIEYKEPIVNELKRNIADLSKIQKLGYKPTKSLEEFIKNDLI